MKQIKSIKSNTELIKSITNSTLPEEMSIGIGTFVAAAVIAAEDIDAQIPPTPRVEEEPKYPRSLQEVAALDLSFLNDDWAADMLRDGMNAVVLAQENPEIIKEGIDIWNYMSGYEPPQREGFMFSRANLVVESIQFHMKVGHSGSSMAHTMRHLQLLAKIGFPEYRNGYLKK